MIKLKFTYDELVAFYHYLLKVTKGIKVSLQVNKDLAAARKLHAELFELNRCYLTVFKKVQVTEMFGRKKSYTVSITPMQGYLICTNYETTEFTGRFDGFIHAILTEKTNTINKQLLL